MKKSIVDQSNTEEIISNNANKMNKDRHEIPKEQQANFYKSSQGSQQHGKHKIKYETAQQQKEFIQRNMEKYKQIFDSRFLNEGDKQQKQNTQQILYSGRSNPAISENQQPTLSMQNDTNNTGKKLQFRYNSQGNLSPSKRHEISIIQPSNAQTQQVYAQMTSNNDLSTSFIPKNIFEDILTNPMKDNSQQVTLNAFKSVKVSSTRLEPISSMYSQGENRLADEQLRQKAQNAQQLLSQQKKLQLKSIKSNHDVSYFKDQKDYRYSGHIDPQTGTNTYILKNPAVLFHSSQEQKKGNVYIQMYEHSHNKEKFDTDLVSIQNKIITDELRKSVSQQNINTHNISNILSHTGAKIMDSNKTSVQNLTQNQLICSFNNLDSKQILQKRMSAEQNSMNQQQSQNNSTIQNGYSVSDSQKLKPNKDTLLTKPTNRNEVLELENWLTEMIDKVQLNEYMNIKEVFDQIQIIYVACMKELIRQITIQCKDRGRLLQKVWDSYLDILQRGIDQTQSSKIGEEKEYLDEVTRIHKMYDQTIKLIETELEKKKKEVKDQSKQSEQFTDAIQYFRKKVKMFEIEIKKAQQMEEELRFELEAALSENLKLKLLQGENKSHDDNHNHYHNSNNNQSKNSNQISLSNTVGEEQFQQKNQDTVGVKSIQQINFDNALSKKTSMTNLKVVEKKSKVSVVSHLINFTKRNIVEDEDDEKKKKDYLNLFKHSVQEKDAMSDDSDIFGKNEEKDNRQRDLEFFMEEEKKLADLQIPELELFDIVETGVQTDDIKISENEHINFLIKELSQNSIFADSSPELTSIYTNSYQIVKQSGLDLSQKETILNALDHCKLQVVTYEKLAYVNGQLATKNTELQQQTLDLGIQLKEVEQNYIDKKRRWKKKALTYIEKIKSQEEQIQTLESTTQQMEHKLVKNFKQKQMVTAVIGKLLKRPTQQQDEEELEVLDQSPDNLTQEENRLFTEEFNDEKNMSDSQFIGSLILEQQQQQELQNLQSPKQQGIQRILSQYLSKEVLEENGAPKSKEELNKLLIKLGDRRETDLLFSRGKKPKGSILESKKLAQQTGKQTKRIYSQNTNQATNILENILKKRNSIKSAVVPLASIKKFFTLVYQEILKNEQAFRIPLHVSCYDILIQKHGLKRVAEDKLARIMKSVYIYKDKNIKMEMVATFLGLNNKYDEIDYYYFLLGLKHFQNINHNILNLNSEHGQIVTEKAIDFVNFYFQDKLEKEGFNKLITDIKMTSLQKGIELELLIKKCLFYYSERKDKYKKHIEDIFYATDLDANDQIELYEFDLIFRFIEKDIYDTNQVEEIFFEEADNINPSNGEKALSLNKFVNLCVQKNLFSQEKCQAFNENFKEQGVATNFELLKENASEYKKQIKNRFLKAGKFMSEIKQIIKTLFKLIAEPSPQRPNSLWVSYLLMEKESRAILIDFEANILLQSLLPVKIQMLHIIGRRFEEIL